MQTIKQYMEQQDIGITEAAYDLEIQRSTAKRYLEDVDGIHHIIVERQGGVEFFTNLTNKINSGAK